MAQVIERREYWIEEIPDAAYRCRCGRGFSVDNSYGVKEGDPCDICGKPLKLTELNYIIKHPAVTVVKCDCGAKVECEHFTNTCDRCGADYNAAGQRLADRSRWGDENGESLSDILMADRYWGEDD